jgi:hypothetical protein
MRARLLGLIFSIIGHLCYGQVDFKSSREIFTVTVPVDPTEQIDTVDTEFGKLPRYLMMAKTVDHGKNLMYIVEVLDLSNADKEINIDNLKQHYIKRKSSNDMGFKLMKEEKLNEMTKHYEIELIFADKHGMSLDFVRLFKRDSKFYSIETVQLKGSIKVGTKPTKLTQDYFDSFKIIK